MLLVSGLADEGWTRFMDGVFKLLHENGVTKVMMMMITMMMMMMISRATSWT